VRLAVALFAAAFSLGVLGKDIRSNDLPEEAKRTLRLIKENGPFPFKQDGATFGNRERRLPQRAHGYYREYTVRTPGAKDRGPRRIVAGNGGEFYYTPDHYQTFSRVRD
jgi:ribonuclease T1